LRTSTGKEQKMKKAIMGLLPAFLFYGIAEAGMLSGRIIQENGGSLANTEITIQGRNVMTNAFGGYAVELPDGTHELNMVIHGASCASDSITIYSPRTKQNWRLNRNEGRLIKIQ
jgi:hypothetical protein